MNRVTLVALASIMVVMTGPAFAGSGGHGHGGHGHGFHGRGGHGFRGHGFHGHGLRFSLPSRVSPHHHKFFHGHGGHHQKFFHGHRHGFHGHRFHGHGAFLGGGVGVFVAPSVTTYVPPTYAVPQYVPAPTYGSSLAYAPLMSRVVEHATGRYVLEGDGVTTPYRWVWIPNPPSAPPADEPPATPPPTTPEPSAVPDRTGSLEFYRWTDDAGVAHYTDRLELVPEPYRSRVTKSST